MRTVLVSLSVVCALVLAGPASAIAKADLAARANAICKPTNKKLKRIQNSGRSTGFIIDRVIAVQTKQQRGLAGLTPDAPQRKLYDAFLDNGRKLIGIYKRFRYIFMHPSQSAAARATRKSMRTNAKLEKQAAKLGATVCYAGSA